MSRFPSRACRATRACTVIATALASVALHGCMTVNCNVKDACRPAGMPEAGLVLRLDH